MQSAPIIAQKWDQYPQDSASFSQLPDEEFLQLLQKQFDSSGNFDIYGGPGIDPQTIQPFIMPDFSSPSEDSPSPPSVTAFQSHGRSRQQSRGDSEEYQDDTSLHKRKASDNDVDGEPVSKTQHTNVQPRKASTGSLTGPIRKKGGGLAPEEGRLNKRKEQNRAAQRAFRERKEKHVKDLEDQVAALEAQNEQSTAENTNLRDLLSRLQDENTQLKQQAFTFAVPRGSSSVPVSTSANVPSPPDMLRSASSSNFFDASTSQPQSTVSSNSSVSLPPTFTPDMDWSQLTNFDPAVLSLLDDSPQMTSTDSAMRTDFVFGETDGEPFKAPFTTIATNPMFMTFADSDSPVGAMQTSNSQFRFDQAWSSPQLSQTEGNASQIGLEQFFSGSDFMAQQNATDFGTLMRGSPAMSPVQHAVTTAFQHPYTAAATSSSSSATALSSPSEGRSMLHVRASSSSSSTAKSQNECPKSRDEAKALWSLQGPSSFVKPAIGIDGRHDSVGCEGSTLPSTEPSNENVEVLTAFRHITSDPRYKNVDVNSLCAEFSQKARCDGRKVVVEPDGLKQITESLLAGHHD